MITDEYMIADDYILLNMSVFKAAPVHIRGQDMMGIMTYWEYQ